MKFLSTIKLVLILITTVLSSVGCSNTEEHAPLPVIDSFSPTSGLPGTTITINGSNFDASGPAKNLIRFKSDEALASSATKTQLTVEVPPNASTGNISVIVNNHIANSLSTFTVIQQTKPLSEYISNSSATLQSYDHNNGNPGAVGYQFSVQQDGHISALGIAAPVSEPIRQS